MMIGKGSTFAQGTAVFGTLVSISGPNPTVETVETVDLNSSIVTVMPTLVDNGEVTITCNYDPSDDGIIAAEALLVAPATVPWSETTADGTKFEYPGLLTSRQFEPAPDARSLATVAYTIKVNGEIEVTAGSPPDEE